MTLSTLDGNIISRQSQVLAILDTILGGTREEVKNILLGATNGDFELIQSLVSHPVWKKLHETLGANGYRTLISIRHNTDGGGAIELGYNGSDSKIQTITFRGNGEIISDIQSAIPKEQDNIVKSPRRSHGGYGGSSPYK